MEGVDDWDKSVSLDSGATARCSNLSLDSEDLSAAIAIVERNHIGPPWSRGASPMVGTTTPGANSSLKRSLSDPLQLVLGRVRNVLGVQRCKFERAISIPPLGHALCIDWSLPDYWALFRGREVTLEDVLRTYQ